MKRILLSALLIVGMAGAVAGAASAYFTEQEEVLGNTFTAGEIDIEIRGEGATPLDLDNLAPGVWTDPIEYNIYNLASSLPVKYKFNAEKVSQTQNGMYGLMNVKVRHTSAGTPDPSSWPVVYEGPLNAMDVNSIDDAIAGTLGTNITHVYYMQFQLDSSAGNEYQGKSVVVDFVFDATQPENPGWTE